MLYEALSIFSSNTLSNVRPSGFSVSSHNFFTDSNFSAFFLSSYSLTCLSITEIGLSMIPIISLTFALKSLNGIMYSFSRLIRSSLRADFNLLSEALSALASLICSSPYTSVSYTEIFSCNSFFNSS